MGWLSADLVNAPATPSRGRVDAALLTTVAAAAALVAVGAGAILLVQVDVTDPATGATRACGSAFDGVLDRSGWERWWALDLDESDAAVRRSLVRTERCPDAVNARIVVAFVLASVCATLLLAAARLRARRTRGTTERRPASVRLVRLGRRLTVLGGALSVVGLAAVVALVADADSTLFLHVDRLVVAVVGLVVLIPTVALWVIGRVLVIVGAEFVASADDPPAAVASEPPDVA